MFIYLSILHGKKTISIKKIKNQEKNRRSIPYSTDHCKYPSVLIFPPEPAEVIGARRCVPELTRLRGRLETLVDSCINKEDRIETRKKSV